MSLLDNRFDYSYAISHRLEMPKTFIQIGKKKIKIELLVSNGFVKLYTFKGRLYHCLQNSNSHIHPDWKFHFNICNEDISKSWSIISETLLNHIIKNTKEEDIIDEVFISMKAFNTNFVSDSPNGRQITLYIYQYYDGINEDPQEFEIEGENGEIKKVKYIYRKDEERSFEFYLDLLIKIEKRLNEAKIRKKIEGVAEGELWLGNYVTLRNESFCKNKDGDYVYPPNDKGWNANKFKKPFNWIQIFMIRYYLVYKNKNIFSTLFIISIAFLIFTIIISKFFL